MGDFLRAFAAAHREGPAEAEQARIRMLRDTASELPPADLAAIVRECWRSGDVAERTAVLRALPSLPRPEDYLGVAREGCRTNILPVFEAIAADNPYPARYFDQGAFNQMVIKALFLGVETGRIVALGERLTPELSRMAGDFVSERRVAGRPVPEDAIRLARGERPPRRPA